MRVSRAFSLIEIIVVISLLGIVFSLVLSSFVGKKKDTKLLTLKDIPSYVSNLFASEDSTLYMYGIKCDKSILILKDGSYMELPVFGYTQEHRVLQRDKNNEIKSVEYDDVFIVKKSEHICFRVEFEKSRFLDKFIVASKKKQYLFSPLLQEVESFDNLEQAKQRYKLEELYPNNMDKYYRE